MALRSGKKAFGIRGETAFMSKHDRMHAENKSASKDRGLKGKGRGRRKIASGRM
jgi:hypothetical protein